MFITLMTLDDFILGYKDNIYVSKTKLLIFDYYFNNVPLTNLIDFRFLRDVQLGYDGKIFLHTSLSGFVDDKNNYDYVFQSKMISLIKMIYFLFLITSMNLIKSLRSGSFF